MLVGKRNCVGFCDSCSAPMVCVEEDIDGQVDHVMDIIGATTDERSGEDNRWL